MTELANEKRYPVLNIDGKYGLLTIEPEEEPFDKASIPDNLFVYDIQKAETKEGPIFWVAEDTVDLYRLGKVICKEPLQFDENGLYKPEHVSGLKMEVPPTVKEFSCMTSNELSEIPDPGLLYNSSFGLVCVYPEINTYIDDNNIYIGLVFFDEEEQYFDHFSDVTVNIDPLPYLYGTIDTNNNGDKILGFLERNGFGQRLDMHQHSGFCSYPVFLFNEETLYKVDPASFKLYAEAHGHVPKCAESLDDKIREAKKQLNNTKNEKIEKDKGSLSL